MSQLFQLFSSMIMLFKLRPAIFIGSSILQAYVQLIILSPAAVIYFMSSCLEGTLLKY